MKQRDNSYKFLGKPRSLWFPVLTVGIVLMLCTAALILVLRFWKVVVPAALRGSEGTSAAGHYLPIADIDPHAQDWKGEQPNAPAPKANPGNPQTEIPGYGIIKLDSQTQKLNVVLHNPAGNPVYFVISIVVEGNIIYKTKMIPPGQAVYGAVIDSSINKGTYAAILKYECFHVESLAPLNGADVKVKLVVE